MGRVSAPTLRHRDSVLGGGRPGVHSVEASLTEIVGSIVALGTLFGGALKYLLDRVSKRQEALERAQDEERTRQEAQRILHETRIEQERIRWESVMHDNIAEMRREIRHQEHEIHYLRTVSDAYLRHIAALEGLMRAAGIQIPALVLPIQAPPPMALGGPGPA